MVRSKAQLEQDRADLLAVLEDADGPMWAHHAIAAAYGRRPQEYPSDTELNRGLTDLRALKRAGLVVTTGYSDGIWARWSLPPEGGALTEREKREDLEDLRRRLASSWEET